MRPTPPRLPWAARASWGLAPTLLALLLLSSPALADRTAVQDVPT